jgi:phenylalanyl-tRNA synthetase beta chain
VPRENPIYKKGFALRSALNGAGFDEVYLGVWVGEREIEQYQLDRSTLLALKNPLTTDLTHFRPTALPDLMNAIGLNRKTREHVRLFEVAKIYRQGPDGIDERNHLSGAVASPGPDTDGDRFYSTRDAVLGALAAIGVEAELSRPDTMDAQWHLHTFHPGRWAALSYEGAIIGILGELHPAWVKGTDLQEAPLSFHVDLEPLLNVQTPVPRFRPPPRFPSVKYHLNVLAPRQAHAQDVLSHIGKAELTHLVDHSLHGVYTGKGVPEDKKRLTLELEFNHPKRSLTHDEALGQVQGLRPRLEAAGLVVEF